MKNSKLVMIIATIVVVIIVIIVVVSVVIAKKKPPSYEWTIINNTSDIIPNFSVQLGDSKTKKSNIFKQKTFYIPKPKGNLSLSKGKFKGGDADFFIGEYCPGTYTISIDSNKSVVVTANEINCPESEAETIPSFPPMNNNPESIISFPPMNMYSHSPM